MDIVAIARDIGIPAAGLIAMFIYVVLPLKDRHLKFLDKIELTIDKITETQDKIVDSQNLIVVEMEKLSGMIKCPPPCEHAKRD